MLEKDRPYLRSGATAKVLGICKDTLRKRMIAGVYKFRYGRDRKGWKFDMEDVFRTAFPFASDEILAKLIKEYREENRGYNARKKG